MSIQTEINTDCPYTLFPTEEDTIDRKIDVSLELKSLVDQYYSLYNQNNIAGMADLLRDNPRLKLCVNTSEDYNRLRDGLIAVQRMFLNYISTYLIEFSQPRGEWSKKIKYSKYNVVTYKENNAFQSYIAMKPDIPIGTLPTDLNYWTCITMRGEKGESGSGLTPRGKHELGVQYYVDDLVAYDNCLWYATLDNIDQVPNKGSVSWVLFMQFSGDLLRFNNTGTSLTSTTVQNAIVELDGRITAIKNVTIPLDGFTNNVYTYRSSAISAYHAPDVRFSKNSIPIARKTDMIVEAFDGYMTFTVRKMPTTDLNIDLIILISV